VALLDYHDTYYSASIMKLVICGKEILITLKGWAMGLFSEITNTGPEFPTFGAAVPFNKPILARFGHVSPVKDLRVLDILWPLSSQHWDFLTKPTKLPLHLMSHEGPGSILSYRKAQKLANGLSLSAVLKADVTDNGVQHLEDVVEAVYHYGHIL
jgi:insulysin